MLVVNFFGFGIMKPKPLGFVFLEACTFGLCFSRSLYLWALFFGKWEIILWVCFISLSLLAAWELNFGNWEF